MIHDPGCEDPRPVGTALQTARDLLAPGHVGSGLLSRGESAVLRQIGEGNDDLSGRSRQHL